MDDFFGPDPVSVDKLASATTRASINSRSLKTAGLKSKFLISGLMGSVDIGLICSCKTLYLGYMSGGAKCTNREFANRERGDGWHGTWTDSYISNRLGHSYAG